jgi:hypothetical protein
MLPGRKYLGTEAPRAARRIRWRAIKRRGSNGSDHEIRTMKTIQDMKHELRAKLLITDENKRAETLMRLSLIWGLSGTFSATPEEVTRVMEELRGEFAISQHAIDDAMQGGELLGEVWQKVAKARRRSGGRN